MTEMGKGSSVDDRGGKTVEGEGDGLAVVPEDGSCRGVGGEVIIPG